MSDLEEFRLAASGLGQHPQDHGWRDLYRLCGYGLDHRAPRLTEVLMAEHEARPALSATHLITLLGIALKAAAPESFPSVASARPFGDRLPVLEQLLEKHRSRISDIIRTRQNSFTSARRFIVPQVLMSAFFAGSDERGVRFADLGTGLGILPRQLNSAELYGAFAPGLVWPRGLPAFREIPLSARYGVDRGPLPDLNWVRACYGQSDYYSDLYGELLWTLDTADVRDADVTYAAIDLMDADRIAEFIRQHRINAVNLSYVLYEFSPRIRSGIIASVLRALEPPGVAIVSEPHRELHAQGVCVEFFHAGDSRPWTLCYVSDGHYKGYVIPLDDYDSFTAEYPIAYDPASARGGFRKAG